jgi:hypothetical protein
MTFSLFEVSAKSPEMKNLQTDPQASFSSSSSDNNTSYSNAPTVVMRRRITSENEENSGMESTVDENDDSGPQVGKAFFDYKAREGDELSFQRGSMVEIIKKDW